MRFHLSLSKCTRIQQLANSLAKSTQTRFQHLGLSSDLILHAFNTIIITSHLYKVSLILKYVTNEISALIIGKSGEKLFGMACKDLVMNQMLVDQQQLPNKFLRLIGQKKIFHLRFGNRRNNFNSIDVLIHNVSEDTSIEPITPQTLSKELIVCSTIVSSSTSTPTPEPSDQSYKRKREFVRRVLFIPSEQRNFYVL
ncbi:hypothetical protein DVH24_018936 [Malus domestica]|uniref:Uncharacterized protein n=1 Tax=Malus domestica TaxID=3750 RepID=A0A498HR06_MALDO|nr:hypothetical protein DVH24_018936 [Malus domestica]